MQRPEVSVNGNNQFQVPSEETRVNWWLRVTSSGWDKPQETIEQREKMRRSQLLSWIMLGLFVAVIIFIPATFRDPATVFSLSLAAVGLLIVLVLNRRGLVTAAGVVLVILTICATLSVVVASPGGEIPLVTLPAYDFLVIPIVLGTSILPRISAFVIAFVEIVSIYVDLLFQNKAPDLLNALHQYGYPVLSGRPVATLVIISVIAYLWARGMDQAVRRADRADELRAVERQFTQREAERSRLVEEFVQETMNAIGALANGQEGLMLLPPSHPWQQQATFINNQLHQFYKLKQANKGNYEQVAFAAEMLLRVLQRINSGQAPVNTLDPRQFVTRVALIDEITKHLYFLLQRSQSSQRTGTGSLGNGAGFSAQTGMD